MLLVIIGAVAMCAVEQPPGSSMTKKAAYQRTAAVVAATRNAVAERLSWTRQPNNDYSGSCTSGMSGSDFTGQVQTEVEFTAPVRREQALRYLAEVRELWAAREYPVNNSSELVSARTADDFKVYVKYSPAIDTLHLGGSSPCVWPSGEPPSAN
ncbi:hypothetical protein EV191_112176 [Tamaricihabitans halophyticus]|uniref:Uncharacterized protein n=1 Tax=Tamaricihabitans halophyticus TaxID=1262583 RepID=A0A4R2QE85_9PSEU|nr:hypothetical protein EV191_112176 [Tamaricihabitans halophyticus]